VESSKTVKSDMAEPSITVNTLPVVYTRSLSDMPSKTVVTRPLTRPISHDATYRPWKYNYCAAWGLTPDARASLSGPPFAKL